MNTIIDKRKVAKVVSVQDLKNGECFEFNRTIFMIVGYATETGYMKCINLYCGETHTISSTSQVTKVKIEISVESIYD